MRTWTGWHRFAALPMLTLAFLMAADPWHDARHSAPIALTAAGDPPPVQRPGHHPLRALDDTPLRAITGIQHWSSWRLHQGQARHSHYQHRLTTEPGPQHSDAAVLST